MPTVATNGVETYYERHGEGPPLLFVHGGTSDHQLWQHQVDALRDEYEVITYDMRGHGKTGASDLPRYTIDLFADDLQALVDELGLESPRVCGLSLGGMTALTYAARYSDEPSALAVAGTVTPEIQTLKERAVRQLLWPAAQHTISLVGYDRVQSVMLWIGERISDDDPEELMSKAEQLRDEEVDIAPQEYEKIMGAVAGYNHSPVRLENIAVPTLVLYGEREPMVPDHASIYRRRIADVRIQEIPDASHNSHIQNPKGFTEALREFLADQ